MSDHNYTREDLIAICERSFVPQEHWYNRDSSGAQRQLGECYALIKAGCDFVIQRGGQICSTNDHTIWVAVEFKGFGYFDCAGTTEDETYYLPTHARLDQANGKDWY